MLSRLLPRDEQFFDLFNQLAGHLRTSAQLLDQLFAEPHRTADLVRQIKDVEHLADQLTHSINVRIDKSFITPIDREDIHSLAGSLDDVADYILASAKNLELLHIARPDETCRELARLVNEGSKIVQMAVHHLRDLNKPNAHQQFVIDVNSMENEADEVFDAAIENLFANEKDAIHVIKMRDTYMMLESATDKCEDVANVIESIMIKYA